MSDTMVRALILSVVAAQAFFLLYFVLYNSYTLWLIALSARPVRRRLFDSFIEDLDGMDTGEPTKPLTIIVPVHDEETSVVERLTGIISCDYPRFEVVVVNDGSADSTLERLRQAFRLQRAEEPYRPAIPTAPIRARYRATTDLPPGVMGVIVIDKGRAGKADARNAGINAATAPYIVALDSAPILDRRALKALMRVIQEDPRVVAVGGQVVIANGGTIDNGHWVSLRLPARSLPRFQIVEQLRSIMAARTDLDRLHAVLMLGGVVIFQKERVIRAGGYLTPFVQHRLTMEYMGKGARAVAEDLEMIVRLHRFLLDKLHEGRIAFLPRPVAWTEVPETIESLRRQRVRWYSAVRESLGYHRAIVGQASIEYFGPLIQAAGYLFILSLFMIESILGQDFNSYQYLSAFLLASVGYGALVSVLAVLVYAWPFRYGLADRHRQRLLPFSRRGEVLVLLLYAALENFGYRQLTLYWRLRGLGAVWRGRTGRENIDQGGFRPQEAQVHG